MKKIICTVLRVLLLAVSVLGLMWFVWPISHNVLNIGNALGIFVCSLLILLNVFAGGVRKACAAHAPLKHFTVFLLVLMCAGALWSAAMTACMAAAVKAEPPQSATVLVLGSKASGRIPSADLWARIKTAAAYLKKHPSASCVACGGQGKGESASEASIIRENLIKDGVESGRIFTDGKSVNTEENIRNALKIIKNSGLDGRLAIVTDDYHEFRACAIAKNLGADPYAVPAKTPPYILSACWAREVLAITKFLVF